MRQLLVLAAVAGLAVARPETYREKEDFQFSRSSTDEGSKSGYYGAQRGNMGGNYERAHNMDPLAQNQMSGLVRNVEGELGDGANQHTGSVFTSANSRGVYGSGNYDLSNLQGRNFQEGLSLSDSQSHSSLTSQSSHHGYTGQRALSNNAGYSSSQVLNAGFDSTRAHDGGYASTLQSNNAGYGRSQSRDSRYGGYNTAGNSEQVLYSNSQALNNLQSVSQSEDRNTASRNSGYYSQAAGYDQAYDQGSSLTHTSNGYGSNIHNRLVNGTPVRIIIRPGTKVIVPVATQTDVDSQSTAIFDQNAVNSDTEVLNSNVKPKVKHYESSFSYRKEWEKHNTNPVGATPLAIPNVHQYPVNSELYEDAQAQTLEQQRLGRISSQSQHASHSGYNVNSASSSQSRQTGYNAQQQSSGASTGSNAYHGAYNRDSTGAYIKGATGGYNSGISGAYDSGTSTAVNGASNLNLVEDTNTKPKSYQSSYSYHKSWERQGDPYIIKPSTNGLYDGQVSSKLTAASLNQGAYGSSHQYGSNSHHQSHQGYTSNSEDCDENGHIRVARSYNADQNSKLIRGDIHGQEELGQQTQKQWDDIEDLGQQTQNKWDNLEDLGQQKQKIEDLTQQTQNTWDEFGQQTENKWDKLQDEGQQTQNWGQQETQNKWDRIEDLGQHAQSQWNQHDGQQTQNTWDKLELEPQSQTDLGQQIQDTWTMLDTKPSGNVGRPTASKPSVFDISGQNDHVMNNQKHDIESHSLVSENINKTHHVHHNIWDEIKKEEIGQENEDTVESDLTQTAELGQQTQVTWKNINQNENTYNKQHQETVEKLDGLTNSEPNYDKDIFITPNPHPWMYNQVHHHHNSANQYFAQSSSSSHTHSWQQHSTNVNTNYNSNEGTRFNEPMSGSSIMSLWDKLDNIEKQTIPSRGTDDTGSQHVRQEGNTNVFGTQTQHNVFDSDNTYNKRIEGSANPLESHFHHNVFNSQTIDTKPLPNNSLITSTSAKPTTEEINKDDKIRLRDIGRGDIGPENSNKYKTTEEIETLSLTKETGQIDEHDIAQENMYNKDDRDLSVMSLDQQKQAERQNKEIHAIWQSDSSVKTTTSTTQRNNYNYIDLTSEEKENRDPEQQFEDQGQQNFDQETLSHHVGNSYNTNQHFVDFGQQSVNLGAEQMEQKFDTQSIGQENKERETEDLGQVNEQFDQVSLAGWKSDESLSQQEHKTDNWGQGTANFDQQSQSVWTEDLEGQQVQTVWKPTEDLQQHSELPETFVQAAEDLSQQVEPIWKPTENLQQDNENLEQQSQSERTEDIEDQQIQTAWKSTEDLQQQSQLTEPFAQPVEDLSQHVQPLWNPTENLEQQSQSGWMEDIEDQQVQTAWKPSDDLQQHSHQTEPFAQSVEDLSQQVQTAWKPDLQHQSQQTDTLSQHIDHNKHPSTYQQKTEVSEELMEPKKVADVDSPPEAEVVTDKPGFWKSVGSKFTNAKDKVASWFSSS